MTLPIEPNEVVHLIEGYVEDERAPLDEDAIYRLHAVAAKVYALGFYDGTCVANERNNRRRGRDRAAEREVL